MTESETTILRRLQRCPQCGHRTFGAPTAVCSECGRKIDVHSHNLFLRGSARGQNASFATASPASLLGPALALVVPVIATYWVSNFVGGSLFLAGLGLRAFYEVIKRLAAPPDSFVLACVGPSGFAQVDSLPRWPIADVLVYIVVLMLIGGGIVAWLGLLGLFFIFVSVCFSYGKLRASLQRYLGERQISVADVASRRLLPWVYCETVVVSQATDDRAVLRLRAKDKTSSVYIEFDSTHQEGQDLFAALKRWYARATAVALVKGDPEVRQRVKDALFYRRAGIAVRSLILSIRGRRQS